MSNPAWGMKRICPNCATRYYDFQKDPPSCPVCGTVYDPEALLKSRRTKPLPPEEPVKRKKAAVAAIADDELPDVAAEGLDPITEEDEIDPDMEDGASEVEDDTLLEEDDDDEIEEVDVEGPEEEV